MPSEGRRVVHVSSATLARAIDAAAIRPTKRLQMATPALTALMAITALISNAPRSDLRSLLVVPKYTNRSCTAVDTSNADATKSIHQRKRDRAPGPERSVSMFSMVTIPAERMPVTVGDDQQAGLPAGTHESKAVFLCVALSKSSVAIIATCFADFIGRRSLCHANKS